MPMSMPYAELKCGTSVLEPITGDAAFEVADASFFSYALWPTAGRAWLGVIANPFNELVIRTVSRCQG